jgi:predicted ATPase
LAVLDFSPGESKFEGQLKGGRNKAICQYVFNAVSSWTFYHFHDTSESAPMGRTCSVRDNERLRPDADNLAAFLLRLKKEASPVYELICDTVRLVAACRTFLKACAGCRGVSKSACCPRRAASVDFQA